ncbi:hypothetical protein N9N67_02830 [Bacteriovoracaceae bacterium]|nr:hypothetical protein [Bacteriovoracaceae bacterium]
MKPINQNIVFSLMILVCFSSSAAFAQIEVWSYSDCWSTFSSDENTFIDKKNYNYDIAVIRNVIGFEDDISARSVRLSMNDFVYTAGISFNYTETFTNKNIEGNYEWARYSRNEINAYGMFPESAKLDTFVYEELDHDKNFKLSKDSRIVISRHSQIDLESNTSDYYSIRAYSSVGENTSISVWKLKNGEWYFRTQRSCKVQWGGFGEERKYFDEYIDPNHGRVGLIVNLLPLTNDQIEFLQRYVPSIGK